MGRLKPRRRYAYGESALNETEQWTELSLDCASNRNHCKFTADFKHWACIMIPYSSTFKLYDLFFKSLVEIIICDCTYSWVLSHVYTSTVEMSTMPKFPARPANFLVQPGPKLMFSITKFLKWFTNITVSYIILKSSFRFCFSSLLEEMLYC